MTDKDEVTYIEQLRHSLSLTLVILESVHEELDACQRLRKGKSGRPISTPIPEDMTFIDSISAARKICDAAPNQCGSLSQRSVPSPEPNITSTQPSVAYRSPPVRTPQARPRVTRRPPSINRATSGYVSLYATPQQQVSRLAVPSSCEIKHDSDGGADTARSSYSIAESGRVKSWDEGHVEEVDHGNECSLPKHVPQLNPEETYQELPTISVSDESRNPSPTPSEESVSTVRGPRGGPLPHQMPNPHQIDHDYTYEEVTSDSDTSSPANTSPPAVWRYSPQASGRYSAPSEKSEGSLQGTKHPITGIRMDQLNRQKSVERDSKSSVSMLFAPGSPRALAAGQAAPRSLSTSFKVKPEVELDESRQPKSSVTQNERHISLLPGDSASQILDPWQLGQPNITRYNNVGEQTYNAGASEKDNAGEVFRSRVKRLWENHQARLRMINEDAATSMRERERRIEEERNMFEALMDHAAIEISYTDQNEPWQHDDSVNMDLGRSGSSRTPRIFKMINRVMKWILVVPNSAEVKTFSSRRGSTRIPETEPTVSNYRDRIASPRIIPRVLSSVGSMLDSSMSKKPGDSARYDRERQQMQVQRKPIMSASTTQTTWPLQSELDGNPIEYINPYQERASTPSPPRGSNTRRVYEAAELGHVQGQLHDQQRAPALSEASRLTTWPALLQVDGVAKKIDPDLNSFYQKSHSTRSPPGSSKPNRRRAVDETCEIQQTNPLRSPEVEDSDEPISIRYQKSTRRRSRAEVSQTALRSRVTDETFSPGHTRARLTNPPVSILSEASAQTTWPRLSSLQTGIHTTSTENTDSATAGR